MIINEIKVNRNRMDVVYDQKIIKKKKKKKKGGLALNKAILTLRIFVFTSKIFEQVFGHPKGFFSGSI